MYNCDIENKRISKFVPITKQGGRSMSHILIKDLDEDGLMKLKDMDCAPLPQERDSIYILFYRFFRQTCRVAYVQNELVGFVLALADQVDSGHIYIHYLCVAKQHRGKGIGEMLLQAIRQYGENHAAEKISLMTSNADNVRYYDKFGFARDEELQQKNNPVFDYMRDMKKAIFLTLSLPSVSSSGSQSGTPFDHTSDHSSDHSSGSPFEIGHDVSIDKEQTDEGLFDALAASWHSGLSEREISCAENLLLRLDLQLEHSLLDIGAGTGILPSILKKRGIFPNRYVAVDLSSNMLKELKAAFPEAETLHLDFDREQKAIGLFDLVILYNSIPHFKNLDAVFANARRNLQPGGKFVIAHARTRLALSEHHRAISYSSSHKPIPSDSELLEVSLRHGFTDFCIEDEDYFYFCAEVKK
jgi:demethylmenaquinone methyltransferase/2-methoxy-6-polyprenyl-1,4-benzoquinol methylase